MIKKSILIISKLKEILTKKQKIQFWLVFIASCISAVFEMLGVSIIIPLVNALLTPELLFENRYLIPILERLNIENNQQVSVFVVSVTILLYLLKNAYACIYSWIKANFASRIQRELSVYMMTSYMNRGYSYFLDKNTNQIQQGIVGDVQGIYTIITSIMYSLAKGLSVVLIGISMLFSDFYIAGCLMLVAGVSLLVIFLGFKKPMKETGNRLREYTIDSNQVLLQAVQGIKEVIVTRKQKDFVELYEGHMHKRQKQDIKRSVATEVPNSIVEAISITAIMVILGFRITTMEDPTAFIAVLASFAVGAFRIMPAIGYLSSSFNTILTFLPCLDTVYENIVESKKYTLDFNDIYVEDNPVYKNHKFRKEINIRDVEFSYSEKTGKVLCGVDFDIPKNTAVGLVGESGAGKSTLADILLGILQPEKGEICIDGINIKEVPRLWSSLIGFVPQTIFLADSSIAENVAFGVKKEEIDLEQLRNVLKMANILDFVEGLPDGIWTKTGDRGVRLSGGQRQRIGIARALYHKPEILVLDEATSALDNDTEKSVMEAIESLHGNITMIIIAHRITTLKKCNMIYEIKDGEALKRDYYDLI